MDRDLLNDILSLSYASFNEADQRPLSIALSPEELADKLKLSLPEEAISKEDLKIFCENYLKYAVNTSNISFGNQLWSKVDEPSLVGELLAIVSNTSMYTYEVAPVATLLEHKMISTLNEMIWQKNGDGVMTSGGTASNLQAILCARYQGNKKIKTEGVKAGNSVLLCSKAAHYSIMRAANILGIGTENCIEVAPNEYGQLTRAEIEKVSDQLLREGKNIFCIVATAGTTVLGAYDRIDEIAEFCNENKIWLHVDGAYGANIFLSESYKSKMKGIEKADSLSWDFHKSMGIHLPCAFLLSRHPNVLREAISSGDDSYIFHEERELYSDLGPKSLQCGRRVDILKLWVSWISLGKKGLSIRVETMLAKAKLFAELIKQDDNFELVYEPESFNVCFRYKSEKRLEASIREKMIKESLGLINYSKNDQGSFFRVVVSRPDLEEVFFRNLLSDIRRIGGILEQL